MHLQSPFTSAPSQLIIIVRDFTFSALIVRETFYHQTIIETVGKRFKEFLEKVSFFESSYTIITTQEYDFNS